MLALADVLAVSMCRDGRHAVSSGVDHKVVLWDVGVGKALGVLRGHVGPVAQARVNGRRITTASADGTVKSWDSRTLTCVGTLAGHTSVVRCLELGSEADSTVVTGSDDGTVKIWDLRAEARGSRLTLSGTQRCGRGPHSVDLYALMWLCVWVGAHQATVIVCVPWRGIGRKSCLAAAWLIVLCGCGTCTLANCSSRAWAMRVASRRLACLTSTSPPHRRAAACGFGTTTTHRPAAVTISASRRVASDHCVACAKGAGLLAQMLLSFGFALAYATKGTQPHDANKHTPIWPT